jgi:hypothetical protein
MPQCPDCGCDLPSLQSLCPKCYDARYAEVGSPKSPLESIREVRSNPRRQEVIADRIKSQPLWRHVCWAVIGIGLDWRCAFEWFAGKHAFYSETVLDRTILIVLACASAALLIVCLSRRVKLWFASALFLGLSAVVYDLLSVHWTAHLR